MVRAAPSSTCDDYRSTGLMGIPKHMSHNEVQLVHVGGMCLFRGPTEVYTD